MSGRAPRSSGECHDHGDNVARMPEALSECVRGSKPPPDVSRPSLLSHAAALLDQSGSQAASIDQEALSDHQRQIFSKIADLRAPVQDRDGCRTRMGRNLQDRTIERLAVQRSAASTGDCASLRTGGSKRSGADGFRRDVSPCRGGARRPVARRGRWRAAGISPPRDGGASMGGKEISSQPIRKEATKKILPRRVRRLCHADHPLRALSPTQVRRSGPVVVPSHALHGGDLGRTGCVLQPADRAAA